MQRLLKIAYSLALNVLAIAGLGLFAVAVLRLSGGGELERFAAPTIAVSIPAEEEALPDTPQIEEPVTPDPRGGSPVAPAPVPRPTPPVVSRDLRHVVVLDPGHGGTDGGTVAGKSLEKQLNLDACHRIAKRLKAAGYRVVFTREEDKYLALAKRAEIANRFPAAIFVSIHHNASTSSGPRGVETYHTGAKPSSVMGIQRKRFGLDSKDGFSDSRGELLAKHIQKTFCIATGADNRGIKDRPLAVTRWVSCPAVLVECGFLSNPAERKHLGSDSYRDKMSAGIASGIIDFLKQVKGDAYYGVAIRRGGDENPAVADAQPPNVGS